jgi:Predicted membrane protein involved in D-alanine export
MVFASLSFLIVFLPVLAIVYFAMPAKLKNARQYVLLIFSLIFYGAGEPLYIFLIIACIAVTWALSACVGERKRWALVAAILVNLLPLLVTKYAGFFADNVNAVFGAEKLLIPRIVMPIGISFYTFQVITYIVDLYRGKIERQKNPLLFGLYVMFFPQLIAGPIVKYSEVAEQLEKPDVSWDNIRFGAGRFILGLGKKVLIANQAGYIADAICASTIRSLSPGMAWLCVAAYTVQILFDFAGYSEMAIGLGAIFGFHYPDNFDDPYTSVSVSEFWRRWHITLGRFFREYVYIPLGGNRVSKVRWVLNIMIVWSLTGLWHGASWNFVLWGFYYGILIIIERITGASKWMPKVPGWILTMLFVMVGWGIFLCDGFAFGEMFAFLGRLFFLGGETVNPVTIGSLRLAGYLPFLALGLLLSTPCGVVLRRKITAWKGRDNAVVAALSDIVLIGILVASLIFLLGGTYNPFIYFRF